MKLGIYDIINNPLPQLYQIKEITTRQENFLEDRKIVEVFNKHLKMDKVTAEHIYTLSLTCACIPRGIIQVSIGKYDECIFNKRDMGIGLLLTGAEQFMVFHNHPGGQKKISRSDILISEECREIGDLLGIRFINHIMITQNYFDYCKIEESTLFGL